MLHTLLLLPRFHGALGWWDEIINLIPVVIGIVLVIYLYRSRRRKGGADDIPAAPRAPELPAEAHETKATRH